MSKITFRFKSGAVTRDTNYNGDSLWLEKMFVKKKRIIIEWDNMSHMIDLAEVAEVTIQHEPEESEDTSSPITEDKS